MEKTPNPGSDAAIDMGCTCPVLDNGHGNQELGDTRGFWISGDCPCHAPTDTDTCFCEHYRRPGVIGAQWNCDVHGLQSHGTLAVPTDTEKGMEAAIITPSRYKTAVDEVINDFYASETEKGWVTALQFEVMEDYLRCAQMGHLASDQAHHMEEMRGHFQRLTNFIATELTRARNEALEEAAKAVERKIRGIASWQTSQLSYQGLSDALEIVRNLITNDKK